MKLNSILIAALSLVFCQGLVASDSLPGPLINAAWLAENIDQVQILDTRKELDSFNKEGHIENAGQFFTVYFPAIRILLTSTSTAFSM